MKIKLPKNTIGQEYQVDCTSIIIIGNNGSGKTRFTVEIENQNLQNCHRISAQKTLSFPENTRPESVDTARDELFIGYHDTRNATTQYAHKKVYRWQNHPNISLLNDYDKLLTYLFSEDYKILQDYKRNGNEGSTKSTLDKTIEIWEAILPSKKLRTVSSSLEVTNKKDEEKYKPAEMSDGERVIFYFIAEVLSAQKRNIIIIDEPENHLHPAVMNELWDRLLDERKDCLFIFNTHSVEFATSHTDSQLIWMKRYFHKQHLWDYKIIPKETAIPEELLIRTLGNRRSILFIEGTLNNSLDKKLYELLFPEKQIIPVKSCDNVCMYTKAFSEMKDFHHLNSMGIIDRDRRSNEEISILNDKSIAVLEVSEIENIFLIEEIVRAVVEHMKGKSFIDDIYNSFASEVIGLFEQELEKQVSLHVVSILNKKLFNFVDLKGLNDCSQIKERIQESLGKLDYVSLVLDYKKKFMQYVSDSDINSILKVFNHKGILSVSKLTTSCGLKKNRDYYDLVIKLIKEESAPFYLKKAILKRISGEI